MTGLEFEGLTAANFDKFREHILRSEEAYPETIRSTSEDFMFMLNDTHAIAFVALIDAKYVGNVFGSELCGEDMEACKDHITLGKKTLYVYNLVVDPEYQRKGYANAMFMKFAEQARGMGFETIVGHFRHNGSLHIFKKLGGAEKTAFPNWENSGEDYVLCELDLVGAFAQPQIQPAAKIETLSPEPAMPVLEPSPQLELPQPQDVMPFDMGNDMHGMPSV